MIHELNIFFISFDESNSDSHWEELKTRFPRARRVHGVKGIGQAHYQAAKMSRTHFFFVVDGDNRIRPDFHFTPPQPQLDKQTLYVWRCLNPINSLVYGYGAVKLYNKSLLLGVNHSFVDFATSQTKKYQIVNHIASETYFFMTSEEAWRGAFRECAKLASKRIRGQKSDETDMRLKQWCESADRAKPNWQWVLKGARQGRDFGLNFPLKMNLINNYHWLHTKFLENEKEKHL